MCGKSLGRMCRPSFLGPATPLGHPCHACPTACPSQAFSVVVFLDFAFLTRSSSISPWCQPLPCGHCIQHHHCHHLVHTPSSPSTCMNSCSFSPSPRTRFLTLLVFLTSLVNNRAIATVPLYHAAWRRGWAWHGPLHRRYNIGRRGVVG